MALMRILLSSVAIGLAASGVASAATQYFSYTGARNSWSGANWASSSGGSYTGAWGGYNEAILEGSGGIVSGGSAVNKWTFNATGYTLSGGFTMGSPGYANFVIPNAAHIATVSGSLGKANNANILWKDGAGKLVLGGNNSPYKLVAEQGVLEINGGTTTVDNALTIGLDSFGTATSKLGTIVVSGGSLNISGGDFLMGQTVNGTSEVAQFTQTGGSVTYSGTFMGIANGGGVSQLDFSGGTFTSSATMNLGVRANSNLVISGAAQVNLPSVNCFWSDGVTGSGKSATVDLNGGALIVGAISRGSSLSTSTLNFNGGTLKGRSSNGAFINVSVANVKAGGAIIDSNGFDLASAQPLLDGGGGGGLMKVGDGSFAIGGNSTYTGPTLITAGTLCVNGTINATSSVTITSGSALGGIGTVAASLNTSGNIAPGAPGIGTLTTASTTLSGTYLCEISGGTADRWNVNGDLVLNGASLNVSALSTPTFSTAVIASYTGTRTGSFNVAARPAGISVQYDDANKLIYLVKANDYETWLERFTFANGADTSASGDADGDGVSNAQEYDFGLDPTDSRSSSPIVELPNPSTGTFTYRRRNPSLSHKGYKVWTSTDLVNWTEDTGIVEFPTDDGDDQLVEVYLSHLKPSAEQKFFVRCSTVENAGPPSAPVVSSTAISSGSNFPVLGQTVQIGLPTNGAGLCVITDPTGAVSRLDISASGTASWTPTRYGKHVLQCPGYTRNLWVLASPMYFSWWDVRWSPDIENATAVMAIPTGSEATWQRRGSKLVGWVVGEYAHRANSGYNPPYSVASDWVNDWLRAKANNPTQTGFALDEIYCGSGEPNPAIAEAIYQFRQQVGPDYLMTVYSGGAESSFGPYAHYLRDSNALFMIESYYGDEALFAQRWNDMKNLGLASQTVFAIGPGFRLNASTHGPLSVQEVKDEFAKVRRVAPESPGITMYNAFSIDDRTTIEPAIDAACSQAIEDYFLKPVIYLTGGSAKATCWNIGNDDANGFVIEWYGSAGKISEQTIPTLIPQQKLILNAPAGTTKGLIRPAAGFVNIQPSGVTITP